MDRAREYEPANFDDSSVKIEGDSVQDLLQIENISTEKIGRLACVVGNCGDDATRKIVQGSTTMYACADDAHVKKLSDVVRFTEKARSNSK